MAPWLKVEWALLAADETGCGALTELVINAPVVLPASGQLRVQVSVDAPGADGSREARIYSQPEGGATWTCHCTAVLDPRAPGDPGETDGLAGPWPPNGSDPIDVTEFYEQAAAAGYEYGPAFQGLRAAWRCGPDVLAEVILPHAAGSRSGYGIHPALLDAVLHAGMLIEQTGHEDRQVRLPFAWNDVSLQAEAASSVRVRLSPLPGGAPGVRLVVADTAGRPVLSAASVVTRPADPGRLRTSATTDGLFTVEWIPVADPIANPGGSDDLPRCQRCPVKSAMRTQAPPTGDWPPPVRR